MKDMKYFLSILILVLATVCAQARDKADDKVAAARAAAEATQSVIRNPYRGYSWRVDEEGDTVMVIFLRDVTIYPPNLGRS